MNIFHGVAGCTKSKLFASTEFGPITSLGPLKQCVCSHQGPEMTVPKLTGSLL